MSAFSFILFRWWGREGFAFPLVHIFGQFSQKKVYGNESVRVFFVPIVLLCAKFHRHTLTDGGGGGVGDNFPALAQ